MKLCYQRIDIPSLFVLQELRAGITFMWGKSTSCHLEEESSCSWSKGSFHHHHVATPRYQWHHDKDASSIQLQVLSRSSSLKRDLLRQVMNEASSSYTTLFKKMHPKEIIMYPTRRRSITKVKSNEATNIIHPVCKTMNKVGSTRYIPKHTIIHHQKQSH